MTITADTIASTEAFGRPRVIVWGSQSANPRRNSENSGITALVELNGEDVVYKNNILKALINRFKIPGNVPQGSVNNNQEDGATILLPQVSGFNILDRPLRGAIIKDQISAIHTVDKVRHLGYAWELTCTTQEPA